MVSRFLCWLFGHNLSLIGVDDMDRIILYCSRCYNPKEKR